MAIWLSYSGCCLTFVQFWTTALSFVACDGYRRFVFIEASGKQVVRFSEHDSIGIALLRTRPEVLVTSRGRRTGTIASLIPYYLLQCVSPAFLSGSQVYHCEEVFAGAASSQRSPDLRIKKIIFFTLLKLVFFVPMYCSNILPALPVPKGAFVAVFCLKWSNFNQSFNKTR